MDEDELADEPSVDDVYIDLGLDGEAADRVAVGVLVTLRQSTTVV
jgi:hypothetical protein